MNPISVILSADLANAVGQRAAAVGLTSSAWIAANVSLLVEGDQLIEELALRVESLRQTINEVTDQ